MKPYKSHPMTRNKKPKNQQAVDFSEPQVQTHLGSPVPSLEVTILNLRLIHKRCLKPPRKFTKNNRKTQFNIKSKKWRMIPAVMTQLLK